MLSKGCDGKKVTVNISPKGPGPPRSIQRIYVNTRVKKMMGPWHPGYNPQVHKNMYLHGSMMIACGYYKWIIWWDDGHNWNQLYTGNCYHSAGLKVCDKEDVQGFSDAPGVVPINKILKSPSREVNETTNDGNVSNASNNKSEDLPSNVPVLASTKANPHATFIHYNHVTPNRDTPTKEVQFHQDQHPSKIDNNLFRFFNDSKDPSSNASNDKTNCNNTSNSELSTHTLNPGPEDILKASLHNTPSDKDYHDVLKLNVIVPHCKDTIE